MSGVKGRTLKHVREFVISRDGEQRWRELCGSLLEEDRALLTGHIATSQWYSVGCWNRTVDEYTRTGFDSRAEGMQLLATHVASRDINGIFRFLLKMGSPSFVMSKSSALWNRYFDAGRLTPTELGPGNWQATLSAPTREDEGAGKLTCTAGVPFWMAEALRLTGTRARVTHEECRFGAKSRCLFRARWNT